MVVRSSLVVLALLAAAPKGAAAESLAEVEQRRTSVTLSELMGMDRPRLEALYKASPSGEIPDGDSQGAAAMEPGTLFGQMMRVAFSFFWQGKVFNRAEGTLKNKLGFIQGFEAKVYRGESLLDGRPSIIIDYSGGHWLARAIRDEIREVAPGVYLGFAYAKSEDGQPPRADVMFALDFNPREAPASADVVK